MNKKFLLITLLVSSIQVMNATRRDKHEEKVLVEAKTRKIGSESDMDLRALHSSEVLRLSDLQVRDINRLDAFNKHNVPYLGKTIAKLVSDIKTYNHIHHADATTKVNKKDTESKKMSADRKLTTQENSTIEWVKHAEGIANEHDSRFTDHQE